MLEHNGAWRAPRRGTRHRSADAVLYCISWETSTHTHTHSGNCFVNVEQCFMWILIKDIFVPRECLGPTDVFLQFFDAHLVNSFGFSAHGMALDIDDLFDLDIQCTI